MPTTKKNILDTATALVLSLSAEDRSELNRRVSNALYEAEVQQALANLKQGDGITFSPDAWKRYLTTHHR